MKSAASVSMWSARHYHASVVADRWNWKHRYVGGVSCAS